MINWGILGTGNIAHSFCKDFRFVKGGRLLAVASRRKDKAENFSKQFGISRAYGSYQALINDPAIDVIYIATPHQCHYKNTIEGLQAGKAVLCEKPLTDHIDTSKALKNASKSMNVYLMEAMWTYFLPPILKAKEWIEAGKIGYLQHIKADFGFKANPQIHQRLFDPATAGGALLDIGIYPIALATLFFQTAPRQITVEAHLDEKNIDMEEIMIFNYENNCTANLSASIAYEMPNEAILIGEQGYIRIPDFFMAKNCYLYGANHEQINEFHDDRKSTGYNYEIEAVQNDLILNKVQNDVMPLQTSLLIQDIMRRVKDKFS